MVLHRYATLLKSITSITFENPGSAPAIESLIIRMKKLGYLDVGFKINPSNSIVINNEENWINTVSPQFGTVYVNPAEFQTDAKILPEYLHALLPQRLKEFTNTAALHLDRHNLHYFKNLEKLRTVTKWPVGLFSDFTREQLQPIKDTMSYFSSGISGAINFSLESIIATSQLIEAATTSIVTSCSDTIYGLLDYNIDVITLLAGETHEDLFGEINDWLPVYKTEA